MFTDTDVVTFEAQCFDPLRYYFFILKRRRSARTWRGVLEKGGRRKRRGGTSVPDPPLP